jgi:CspA family cold shock protein
MPSGTIKKIVGDRGFGFIRGEDGMDIFFHHSSVEGRPFEELTPGQSVEYTLDRDDRRGKGPRAASVIVS